MRLSLSLLLVAGANRPMNSLGVALSFLVLLLVHLSLPLHIVWSVEMREGGGERERKEEEERKKRKNEEMRRKRQRDERCKRESRERKERKRH